MLSTPSTRNITEDMRSPRSSIPMTRVINPRLVHTARSSGLRSFHRVPEGAARFSGFIEKDASHRISFATAEGMAKYYPGDSDKCILSFQIEDFTLRMMIGLDKAHVEISSLQNQESSMYKGSKELCDENNESNVLSLPNGVQLIEDLRLELQPIVSKDHNQMNEIRKMIVCGSVSWLLPEEPLEA